MLCSRAPPLKIGALRPPPICLRIGLRALRGGSSSSWWCRGGLGASATLSSTAPAVIIAIAEATRLLAESLTRRGLIVVVRAEGRIPLVPMRTRASTIEALRLAPLVEQIAAFTMCVSRF